MPPKIVPTVARLSKTKPPKVIKEKHTNKMRREGRYDGGTIVPSLGQPKLSTKIKNLIKLFQKENSFEPLHF